MGNILFNEEIEFKCWGITTHIHVDGKIKDLLRRSLTKCQMLGGQYLRPYHERIYHINVKA